VGRNNTNAKDEKYKGIMRLPQISSKVRNDRGMGKESKRIIK